jgi:hypothetical protein
LAPPGNPNPAGDIDGRLANLFLPIDLFFLLQPANAGWPTNNVPPCVTLTPSPATVIISAASPGAATLIWGPATSAFPLSFPPTQCSIMASDGTFLKTPASLAGAGSVSTGPLTTLGTYSAELSCSAAAGNSITSFTQAMINVIALASINVTPPAPQVAADGTTQLTATGTYTDGSTQNLTATATWVSSAPSVATVSAGLVSCSASGTSSGSATISATGATATGTTTGSTTVTCQAPQLKYITITSRECEIPAGGKFQLTAIGTYASGATKNLTSTATWTSSASSVATVSAGLVSCKAPHSYYDGHTTVSASVGSVSGSTNVTCEGLGR